MRLLIGNDLDDSILHKVDVRAWAQRIFWFAQDGDAVILMDEPDGDQLDYVTRLTGVDKSTLSFFVLPNGGRFGRRMFDHQLLLDPGFLERIRPSLADVEEVRALWHSPMVQVFLEELGLGHVWPGGEFYLQNGAECLNNMGNFRAFAKGAQVPVAEGTVCRTQDDAVYLSRLLLKKHPAVMVKKAHGGAGAGNLLLTRDERIEGGNSGNSRRYAVDSIDASGLPAFWAEHWDWASSNGRYPVVIEQYVRDAKSIYVEFHLDDKGSRVQEVGELQFENSRQVREVVPTRSVSPRTRTELVADAQKLADFYHRLGHRGFLSADSVVRPDGTFAFTEVNAQFTGSSHLHSVIAGRLVRAWERDLSVTQMASPPEWELRSVRELQIAIENAGLGYALEADECVIPITPCIGDRGLLILAIAHPVGATVEGILDRVATSLFEGRRVKS